MKRWSSGVTGGECRLQTQNNGKAGKSFREWSGKHGKTPLLAAKWNWWFALINLIPCLFFPQPHNWETMTYYNNDWNSVTLHFWRSCEEEKQSNISHILLWLSGANYSWAHQREKSVIPRVYYLLIETYERQQSESPETQPDTLLAHCFKALKRLFKLDDRCRGRYSLSGQISPEIPPGTP